MKPPVVTGVVVGLVLLLALWILPRVLPSTSRAAVRAQEAIAGAHQDLTAYDPLAVAARSSSAEVAKANVDQLVAQAEAQLQLIAKRSAALASDLQRDAKEAGVRLQTFTPITANASAVRDAVSKLDEIQRQNQARLAAARKTAGEVRSASSSDPTAPHLAGLVNFTQAASLLSEAQRARLDQHRALDRARTLAANMHEAQNELAYLEALREPGLIEDLRQTQSDLAARREEVAMRLQTLRDQVEQRQSRVAELSLQLGAQSEQLEQLRQAGSAQMGSEPFAQRVREAAGQVRDLQLELQVLQNGGLQGAKLNVTNGLLDALIEGGEPVLPLGSLQEELAGAEETHKRLASGEAELGALINQLEERGRMAADLTTARKQFADTQRTALQEELTRATTLAGQAGELEAKALQEIQSAASAFTSAATAASQWKNAARTTQGEFDPERKNWRLKMIQGDASAESLGTAAAAEAKKLALQAYVQQAAAAGDMLTTGVALQGLDVSFPSDAAALRQQIADAKQAGAKITSELVPVYETTLANQLPPPVKALATASLAAVHRANAQLAAASTADPNADPAAAERQATDNARASAEQLAAATRAINAAADALGKHPAVGPRITNLRTALSPPAPATQPSASTTQPGADTQPAAASQPDASDDLFGDD